MATPAEIENRLRKLNEKLADYIPSRETWTPADEALSAPGIAALVTSIQ
ncbi:MAG: hypothetical protein ACXV5T_07420 [Halobacteriota archaeon]